MDVLINKNYKTYDYLSRYTSIPYYYHKLDGKYIYGIGSQLSRDTAYTLYNIKKMDTWDSIALDFYNNPTLFWVITDFNSIQNPYNKPIIGTQIKIPLLSNIVFKE